MTGPLKGPAPRAGATAVAETVGDDGAQPSLAPSPAPDKGPPSASAWAARGAAKVKAAKDAIDKKLDGWLVGPKGVTMPPGTPLQAMAKVQPENGKASGIGIFVNGVMTPAAKQSEGLQELANITGKEMIGVHNATSGLAWDVESVVTQKLGLGGKEKPTAQLSASILEALDKKVPISLYAHSQGAIVLSDALGRVQDTLKKRGMSQAQAEEAMNHINVETFATAASKFPDGPVYVHYVNDADNIPKTLGTHSSRPDAPGTYENLLDMGLNKLGVHSHTADAIVDEWKKLTQHPGRGAVIIHFNDPGDGRESMSAHRMGTYLKHRVTFEEARQRPVAMAALNAFWAV
jgi:hypothetical protein